MPVKDVWKINKRVSKLVTIEEKNERTDIKLESGYTEQMDSFKCVGSYVTENMIGTKEINASAIGKEVFNRKNVAL